MGNEEPSTIASASGRRRIFPDEPDVGWGNATNDREDQGDGGDGGRDTGRGAALPPPTRAENGDATTPPTRRSFKPSALTPLSPITPVTSDLKPLAPLSSSSVSPLDRPALGTSAALSTPASSDLAGNAAVARSADAAQGAGEAATD